MTIVSGALARSHDQIVAAVDAEVGSHEDDRRTVCLHVIKPFAEAFFRLEHAHLSGLDPLGAAAILQARSVDVREIREVCLDLLLGGTGVESLAAEAAAEAVLRRSWEVRRVLHRLVRIAQRRVAAFADLVESVGDYSAFTAQQRADLAQTAALVQVAVRVLGTPLLVAGGLVSLSSELTLADANRFLDAVVAAEEQRVAAESAYADPMGVPRPRASA